MNNPNHHLSIHGHFYQPPRENPWLGIIEFQDSALPFNDWNERINAECYAPLTCSPLVNRDGQVSDLFNCYPHLSFNFGATLLTWLEKKSPETLTRLRVADEFAQQTYRENGAAMAQVYNHVILPLADCHDTRTQIIWGLHEFHHRFNRHAESIWLSETAINMATVNCLIDHNIRYLILSPYQASYCRQFGAPDWNGVPDGTIDTRLPYRLFAVDGAGNTHFDRYLDIFFYDKNLSTKVSFEHLLADAQRLENEIAQRFTPEATLPQLVLIATDGEIYGHHEKFGNRALAYFQAECLQHKKMTMTNLTQFWRENPPQWEVRLWEGLDGKGSSWSCTHGVARWENNCGCGSTGSGNQEWRAPLRSAFNNLRTKLREIFRREIGGLVWDITDARNDYIRVILSPTPAMRADFLARHSQKPLNENEQIKLWSLLEAERYAMLMFTSCGWFFHELSGIEPVQNMRYALRAIELSEKWANENLQEKLENDLSTAMAFSPTPMNGQEIFQRYVMPTRYSSRTISAAQIAAKLCELPEPTYNTQIILKTATNKKSDGAKIMHGEITAQDTWTTATEKLFFIGALFADNYLAIYLDKNSEAITKIVKEKTAKLREILTAGNGGVITITDLPFAERQKISTYLLHKNIFTVYENTQALYPQIEALLQQFAEHQIPMPPNLRQISERILGDKLGVMIWQCNHKNPAKIIDAIEKLFSEAARVNLSLPTTEAAITLTEIIHNKIIALAESTDFAQHVDELSTLLDFAPTLNLPISAWDKLRDAYWNVLHHCARPEKERLRPLSKKLNIILHNV